METVKSINFFASVKEALNHYHQQLHQSIGVSSRTLNNLRWIEVLGQFTLVMIVGLIMEFPIALKESLALIVLLGLLNLYFSIANFRLGRLNEYRALPMLAVDIIQVALLAGFNGGINNPFIFMILAPLVVAATVLSKIGSSLLTILSIILVTGLVFYAYPMPWKPDLLGYDLGAPALELPWFYQLAIWLSLIACHVILIGFIWTTSADSRRLSSALAEATVALSHERELSALGALSAAAAHELGSPLATISVVTRELKDQNIEDPRNWKLIQEDHQLLYEQAVRCREILLSFSKAPPKDGGDPYERPTLSSLIAEIAKKHVPDHLEFITEIETETRGMEPNFPRMPEFINGIGNLLSNAGQFAKERVSVKLFWDWNIVKIVITDDGPGFPAYILQAAGEPYQSTRSGKDGHMGLGLFIAITLLESIGGALDFRNHNGAEINIKWAREQIDAFSTPQI